MSGDGRTAGVEKEMRRRRQLQRLDGKNAAGVPNDRRTQSNAVGQRRAAEELDRRTDRAVDIAGEPLPGPAAGALRVRKCQRLMAALQRSENLAIEMPEAEDELEEHRQQRQELRRAAEMRPPDGKTTKHWR